MFCETVSTFGGRTALRFVLSANFRDNVWVEPFAESDDEG